MSGEGLYGPDAGKHLPDFPLEILTVKEASDAYRDLAVSLSDPGWFGTLAGSVMTRLFDGKGMLPPGFRGTMGEPDDRLPELTTGVGVVVAGRAKFYPFKSLRAPLTETYASMQNRDFRAGLMELAPLA